MQWFHNSTKIAYEFTGSIVQSLRINCTYFTIVGIGHSLKLCTFESLLHIPSDITSKPEEHFTIV